MTKAELKEIERIENMSRIEMARLWRYAPSSHSYFNTQKPYFQIFKNRFAKLGGFTPKISKQIDKEARY